MCVAELRVLSTPAVPVISDVPSQKQTSTTTTLLTTTGIVMPNAVAVIRRLLYTYRNVKTIAYSFGMVASLGR